MKKNSVSGNQGFILMTTLMVGTVLTVLSGAYFASSLSQSNIAKKQFEASQEFYGGETGIAKGYVEAKKGVVTHEVVGANLLQKKTTPPTLNVSGSSIDSASGAITTSGGKAKVKIFKRGDDIIVLSQAVDSSGNLTGPVHRFLLSQKSLYKYFQFYDDGSAAPGSYSWYTGASGQAYSGKLIETASGSYTRVGGIHVNGDIMLGSATFSNLSELSCSRYIRYYNSVRNTEPAYYDFQTWDPAQKKMVFNYNKSSWADCKVDGFAPIPRFDYSPYNFKYPLTYDPLRISAAPFKEEDGIGRNTFIHPNILIYGYDVTDGWNAANTPANYGWISLKIDTNSNGIIDTSESFRIPKILPTCYGSGPPDYSSNCLYQWDKYNNTPKDNYAGGDYKLLSTGSAQAEPPVRFQVTNDDYKYEALKWLTAKEIAAGEYNYANQSDVDNRWLKTTNSSSSCSNLSDNRWDSCEYDRVTLLSVKQEPGEDGLDPASGQGLYNNSEYEIYAAVKQYWYGGNWKHGDKDSLPDSTEETFPVGINDNVKDWIKAEDEYSGGGLPAFDSSSANLLDDFFCWWKQRSYHHKEDLGSPGGSFSGDTATVPAWERLFWEAWINYWPPARGLVHNQIYLPSEYRHALNSEWWEDLVYGSDRDVSGNGTEKYLDVPYLNTADPEQADKFALWLEEKGLYNPADPKKSVVKFDAPTSSTDETHHGGEYLTPLNIKATYSSMAQTHGLYIYQTGALGIDAFTVSIKKASGVESSSGSIVSCLTALGLSSFISVKQFYNPYTIAKGTYLPTESPNVCNKIYGWVNCSSLNKDAVSLPPPVKAIEINIEGWRSSGITLDKPVIYIESVDYDVLLTNGYKLPAGGLTLVSPYDVYVKAQKKSEKNAYDDFGGSVNFDLDGTKNEDSAYGGLFNYEKADRASLVSADSEANHQPAAVITNSRAYLLSPEFPAGTQSPPEVFPYCRVFPDWPNSLRNNYFLQGYCYDYWPQDDTSTAAANDFPVKPGSKSGLTWNWIRGADLTPITPRLNDNQQRQLMDIGNSQYTSRHSANLINRAGYNQFYNFAIASPFEPGGYRLEDWRDSAGNQVKAYHEGAFIKIGYWKNLDSSYVPTRYHTPGDTVVNWYERTRFKIPAGYEYLADDYKVYWNDVAYVNFEYEERFWIPGGTPAGDFLSSGYEQRWDQLSPVVSGKNTFEYDIPPVSS